MTAHLRTGHGGIIRTGRAIITSARRALGLAAPGAAAPPPAAQARPGPASPHLLYHG
jgi:hypothetical protein